MAGHDPQRTSRSPSIGPLYPRLLFRHSHVISQPLVGPDNTIYGWSTSSLFAVGAANHHRWVYAANEGDAGGPAALRPDGTLIAVGYPAYIPGPSPAFARVFAIASSGHLSWKFAAHDFSKGVAPYATSANVFYAPYVGPQSGKLDVLSASGRVLRRFTGGSFYSVAQALDGTVYAFLKGQGLVALDSHGSVLWQNDLGISDRVNLPIVVGRTGTVYVTTSLGVAAHDARGRTVWQNSAGSPMLALAEAPDGSLLGIDEHSLTKIDSMGHMIWSTRISDSTVFAPPALAVDARGTV